MKQPSASLTDRRKVLFTLAAGVAGAALVPVPHGLADDDWRAAGDICTLTPQTTAGPYYFDPGLERVDITEGRPGLPMALKMQVVDATCRPLPGARVDVWHCDATGLYSGYDNRTLSGSVSARGETFLRGTQFANETGIVTFETIFPGWYPGRTAHIHFMIYLDSETIMTGQIFFDEAQIDRIYAEQAPYNARAGDRDRYNQTDSIARRAGAASVADMADIGNGIEARLIVGVAG